MKKIIIGLDPGTFHTGYGVIAVQEENYHLLEYGVFSARSSVLAHRIQSIGQDLNHLYRRQPGAETAIEKVFCGKNPDTAFKLGQIFGLCVYQAGLFGSPVFSYASKFIKQSVTGSGRSDKEGVKIFMQNRFPVLAKEESLQLDAVDALAAALCHAVQPETSLLLETGSGQ